MGNDESANPREIRYGILKDFVGEDFKKTRKTSRHVTEDLLPKTVAGIQILEYRQVAYDLLNGAIIFLIESTSTDDSFAMGLIILNLTLEKCLDLKIDEMGNLLMLSIELGNTRTGFAKADHAEHPYILPIDDFKKILLAAFPEEAK